MSAPADPLAVLMDLPGVAAEVAAARSAVDRLLGHPVLRRRSAEVSAESALRGARASADLAGAALSLAELKAALRAGGLRTGEAPAADGSVVVAAAVRLYAELGPLAATFERAPRQALARMHVLAAGSGVPEAQLGRPRSGPTVDADSILLGLGAPPPPGAIAGRLDDLAALLTGPTAAPAIVLGAVVHAELLLVRPFVSGNAVVARAASRLVHVTRRLDPKAVTVPEVGHAELREAYPDAARAYATGSPDGVACWLRHCAQAIELGAREGLAVCEALRRRAGTS